MIIKSFEVNNYRNYNHEYIELTKGINVFVGKNAQGKTNLLEAVFLCAVGKSIRTNKDKDLINWKSELGSVKLNFMKIGGNKKIELYLQSDKNKSIKINSMPIKKIGELMGEFNAIYFSPDEMKLVKDSPEERRRFMDISLSQFNKNYFYALSKYNKILMQRNKLLKNTFDKNTLTQTISIWNEQLATVGEVIVRHRIELIEKLKIYATKSLSYLTSNTEELVLEYSKSFSQYKDDIKQSLLNSYNTNLDKDIKLGYTTTGPHRDDFKIIINDIDVRYFGSQGQQRTCALALKLAELEIFKENIGEYPILILDDVLSELDINRQTKLLQAVSGVQTLISGTDFSFSIPHTLFIIDNGKVVDKKVVS